MRKTKIVCTIGPASENKEVLTSLIKAGLNVMRLNFSHGDHAEHLAKVNTLREINKELGTNVAFMLDTMGPEIRTTDFEDGEKHKFTKGDKLTLTTRAIKGNDKVLGITYEGLPNDVEVGGHILIDDGLIDLIVDKIDGTEIECTLQNSGMLKGRRGINVPGAKLQLKAMTDKDKDDLRFAVENNFDFVAASFIRKPQDVLEMREYLDSVGENRIKIISKIENQEGLDNFDEILKVTDGVMVARGDLGVEIPMEELPAVQKMMIKKCVLAGKPVITATQMLDSMQSNPRPTRAEVSDVANAIYDGTSAIMLSGESAQGDYPLECVQTMAKIADATEANIDYWKRFKKRYIERLSNIDKSELSDDLRFKQQSNFAVCCSAMFSNADAIIAVSEHSITPSMLSGFKPDCPIYVITANQNTYRQMGVEHNVYAVYIPNENNFDNILSKGIDILKEKGLLKKDDTVVLSGGFPQETKRTFLSNHATGTILKI